MQHNLKKKANYNLNNEIAYETLYEIPISTKKYKKRFSDLDLESICRIKLFHFNRHCGSFILIKSNNKTISNT